MFAVHDPLVCDRAHNRDWPEGITQQIFEACEEMADFSLAQMFFSFEAARLSGGNLVGEVSPASRSRSPARVCAKGDVTYACWPLLSCDS